MRGGEVLVDYKFKDIISNCCERIDPSDEEDVPYVGLEHINPDTFNIPTYGKSSDVKGQKFKMKKGDVLFGRRRAYQRKVAIAPFDGIFSAHGMIFRPKDVIDEELLPFFIRSDAFMDKAISLSVGSLSPTLNWGAIKDVSFSIPSKELQPKLSSLLWKIENDAILLKEQISFLDVLVKSRFIEMFSDYDKVPLTNIASINMGQSPDSSTYNDEGRGIPFYQGKADFTDVFVKTNIFCDSPKKQAMPMDILMSVRAPVGTVNITRDNCCIGRGLAAITPKTGLVNVWFLFYSLRMIEGEIESMGVGSTFKAINKSNMSDIKIRLPPIELQIQFADFVKQVDKSKFELQKHLEDTKRLQKALINQAFSPRSAHD